MGWTIPCINYPSQFQTKNPSGRNKKEQVTRILIRFAFLFLEMKTRASTAVHQGGGMLRETEDRKELFTSTEVEGETGEEKIIRLTEGKPTWQPTENVSD